MTLQSIPIKQIFAGNNPRKDFDEKAIEELAASIKQHGVIQPIMVRPLNDHMYEIVCGERRWRASKIAEIDDIPANVRELTDDEAFEISITENLQRKDVHPLDEAAAYETYKEMKKVDIQELAAKFGKTPTYIAQRLSFNALIPELKKDFHAGILLISHAVLLARLQPVDQKTIMAASKVHFFNGPQGYESVEDMKDTIAGEVMQELTQAAFDKKDTKLVRKAGACIDCHKRSGAGLLFADVKEKDRCFDGACYKSKIKAHLLNQVDKLVISANPMPVIVGYGSKDIDPDVKKKLADNKIKLLVEDEDYIAAPKKSTGSTLALRVNGSDAGRIVGIVFKKTEKAQAAKAAAPGASEEETIASIDAQIAGIKERGKRSDELDAEKVHARITGQLEGLKPFLEVDPAFEFVSEEERAGILYILFEKLGNDDKKKVCSALKVKGDARGYGNYFNADYQAVAKALQECPNHVGAFIWRAAIKNLLIGNKLPPSPEAFLMRKIAEAYEGVPIATYEAEQKVIADKRKENAKKRIADLEKKKKLLAPVPPVKKKKAGGAKGKSAIAKGISSLLNDTPPEQESDDE